MIECRTYTHARRFPLVIGKVGGYALPTPLTPVQVLVLVGLATAEILTRRWWAVLPGPLDLVVAMVLPVLAAWAVRHARVEGRSPLRYAMGLLAYATRPRRGLRAGRRVGAERPLTFTLRQL
ncbi:TcpE family conjugal transfer membrane protein [Euzebya sp.]|uniref:TcpE family conjugal transfer membrane protein n=1 Tax=Euzebya sp. TaxID=1971409 RepID=UPI003511CC7C